MVSRIQTSSDFGSELGAALQQVGGRIVKRVNDAMQTEMKVILKNCQESAPVEHGNLEDAIKLDSENRRRKWIIYVDESMPDDTGKYTVGDYAMLLHEGTSWTPGKLSEEKFAANGKPADGRKYLERPFEEAINNGIVDRLAAVARDSGVSDAPGTTNSQN